MTDSRGCAKGGQQGVQPHTSSSEAIRVQELMERIGGDLDLLSHLLSIFISDYERCYGFVQDAIRDSDGETLHKLAHRMKGALGNFAAHRAFAAAQRLEEVGLTGDLSSAEALWIQLQDEITKVISRLESIIRGETNCS